MDETTTPPAAGGPAEPDLMSRLTALARRLFDATGGHLTAEMALSVKFVPGGALSVSYTARTGECMGKGVNAWQAEYGESPEATAAKLVERVAERDIARRIREEYMRNLALELGYELKPKARKK